MVRSEIGAKPQNRGQVFQFSVPFDFTGYQTVGDVAHSSTAVALDCWSEQAHGAHRREYRLVIIWCDRTMSPV